MKHTYLFALYLFFWSQPLNAQHESSIWQPTTLAEIDIADGVNTHPSATNYELLELDVASFRPGMISSSSAKRTIQLPLPNGEMITVEAQWDPVIAPGLGERYPEINTYRVLPSRSVKGGRLGWTYQGLHATLHTTEGTVYIDPYATTDNRYYVSYYVHENVNPAALSSFTCHLENDLGVGLNILDPEELSMLDFLTAGPTVLQRKYRLAMSTTPSFTNYHGGTVEGGLSAVVAIVNRLNEVYEIDLAIRLELIEDNDKIIYTNSVPNPYPSNSANAIFVLNHDLLVDSIGLDNFDIGHLVAQGGGGGIASLGSVCRDVPVTTSDGTVIQYPKGVGATSLNNPVGDPFTIDYVAHEIGHQVSGNHTMSGCNFNSFSNTTYEPGGGTTIMAYAGICPGQNIQPNSDPYFHTVSLQEIFTYMRTGLGDVCAEKTDLGNTIPDVNLPYDDGFYIPVSTPFELTATAIDVEDTPLTYCWEGFDLADFQVDLGSPVGSSPIFRSFDPTESPTRVFPQLNKIVDNINDTEEILPTYSRDMTFRCTVRDNHPGAGGAAWEQVAFFATEEAGPFLVINPNNEDDNWIVGDYQVVNWDVANTNQGLVNCQSVNIRLSVDGGYTYPIDLLLNAPNTGSAFVTVPDEVTNNARVRVEAADNIFFDISNADFSIEAATEPGYTMNFTPLIQTVCSEDEPAIIDFVTTSILGFDTVVALDVTTILPMGVEASLSSDTIAPGDAFTLAVDFANSGFDGLVEIEVRAIAPGVDTFFRTATIEVINTDFSALTLLTPVEGDDGINLSAPFSWTELSNAQSYDWQLATSPTFDEESIVEQGEGLETNDYTLSAFLEENTLFFWRVRASNDCNTGEWTDTQVFHTINALCEDDIAEDTPVTIPGTGPLPTRTSEINVPFEGVISDINIPIVNVQYQPIQNFRISLISPSGTEVILYDGNCFGTDRVNIGFDDDAPNEIECPPVDNIVFQPVEPLSDFIGESSQGIWTLEVEVTESGFGAAGAIDGWEIEFCAMGSATAPLLINNETLEVPPGLENPISQDFLLVESTTAGVGQLEYTIVSAPMNGLVKFLGEEVEVGETFSQASINAYNVSYEHDGSMTTEDAFTFVVRDGMGGFLPVQTFHVLIDEMAVVNTEEPVDTDAFQLFPNPTSDWVRLVLPQAAEQTAPVHIYDIRGRLIRELTLASGSQELFFDMSQQTAGIYLVQYGQGGLRLIKE